MAVKLNSRNLKLSFVLLMGCIVLGAATARAEEPDPAKPQAMPISCREPHPARQNGLRRPKGDSNTWTFEITTDAADNVHWVEGPNWSYPGQGENADPAWGVWNGGEDGDMSLS